MNAASAVDHVFKIMGATYGAAWDRSLGVAPIQDVKTAWGYALSDFMHSKEAERAIMWGLDNLPDFVPNARQFRSLCQRAPSKEPVMLPAPVVNPEIAHKVLEGLKSQPVAKVDGREWARRLLSEVEAGVKKSATSITMAKAALAIE